MNVLLGANAVGAVASIAFALVGGVRPAALSESGTPSAGERFYGWMYATRGVPLGVAALVAPLAWSGPAGSLVAIGIVDPEQTQRSWSMRGKVVAATTDGAEEHINRVSHKYIGRPYPGYGGGRRILLTVEVEKLHVPFAG
ncbi:hypothetical protein [Streptomyces violaceusniger]|uniref:Uncharacterized protein n=1 Tax=Streptomyces violaceusniger TaxID=68280 RepID=A0A4D4KZ45_STRVO|nr:hypothetical protein SVIO_024130 [Streptomyces violaceusniger]